MQGALFLLMLVLSACGGSDAGVPKPPTQAQDWQLPTGKPPSSAEFAALTAACQDRSTARGETVDACLADDYGMHRIQ